MHMSNVYELRGTINYITDGVTCHFTATSFPEDGRVAYDYDGTMRGGRSIEREVEIIEGNIRIPGNSALAVYALCSN